MDRNGRVTLPDHDLFSGLFNVARKPARQIATSAAITLFGAARQFREVSRLEIRPKREPWRIARPGGSGV